MGHSDRCAIVSSTSGSPCPLAKIGRDIMRVETVAASAGNGCRVAEAAVEHRDRS